MRRQRNMAQMKEQIKTSERELNKIETSALPDAEFKTLVIRMLNELKGRADELCENFNKEIKKNGDRKYKKEPVRKEGYIN